MTQSIRVCIFLRKENILHPIHYILDSQVIDSLDEALRELISACFTKPQDIVFKTRRYFIDPPKHRWYCIDESGKILAHIAVHEKTIRSQDKKMIVCGMSEVCVAPDNRGQGYVKSILKDIHTFMKNEGIKSSLVSGEVDIYQSSGYRSIDNLVFRNQGKIEKFPKAVMKELNDEKWPTHQVFLEGSYF